jgi:ATP-dependent DNA helicase UvrD/PcrA
LQRYLYGNRAAKLVIECEVVPKVIARLEKYFDNLMVDEVQDFAANDFNLLLALSQADVELLFVGDFFQHTFDTSRDGSTRKNLHKKGLDAFIKEFSDAGLDVDTTTLDKTHRCSPSVCDFISSNLGIQIESHRADHTEVTVVEDQEIAVELFNDPEKVKLFFKESEKYNCFSNNWGKSKGLNGYGDICVVLNQTTQKLFEKGKVSAMAESSKNKLYVACSRANGDLYILNEKHLRDLKNN